MRVNEAEWFRHLTAQHRAAERARLLALAGALRRGGVLAAVALDTLRKARRLPAPRLP